MTSIESIADDREKMWPKSLGMLSDQALLQGPVCSQ